MAEMERLKDELRGHDKELLTTATQLLVRMPPSCWHMPLALQFVWDGFDKGTYGPCLASLHASPCTNGYHVWNVPGVYFLAPPPLCIAGGQAACG